MLICWFLVLLLFFLVFTTAVLCLQVMGNLAESEGEVVVHVVQSFFKAFSVGFGDPQEVVFSDTRRSRIRPAKNTYKCCRKVEKYKIHISAWENFQPQFAVPSKHCKKSNSCIPLVRYVNQPLLE